MIARWPDGSAASVEAARPVTAPLTFVVPGRPVPLERPRVEQRILPGGKRVHRTRTPDRSMAYRAIIQLHANLARSAMPLASRWPYGATFPIALSLRIYWADENHGDGDNVLKAYGDAGNGLLWDDDKQIVEGHFWCAIDRKRPRVEVRVEQGATGVCEAMSPAVSQ
jgi:Holliday junction resolvase RusA-like endonuclease